MYLQNLFIQHKFIDGANGQAWHFSDHIIVNAFNNTQALTIVPEVDSYLKIRTKEDMGINAKIQLVKDGKIDSESKQVGINEFMFV